jgi:negative regulator of flagellin synthesis FlgM
MKIDSSVKPSSSTNVSETRSRVSAKASANVQANNTSEVQLSGLASQLKLSGDTPSFDAARVSEIKQAITEGRFTINAGAIADRLISSARELVNSQRQA